MSGNPIGNALVVNKDVDFASIFGGGGGGGTYIEREVQEIMSLKRLVSEDGHLSCRW